MAFNDPIAELLTHLRNASSACHRYVDIYPSKMRLALLKILKEHGYIEEYLVDEEKKRMRIFLKYTPQRTGVFRGLKRCSSPGCHIYLPFSKIPRVLGGIGLAILSTSKGVMDGETARKEKLGGELICTVW